MKAIPLFPFLRIHLLACVLILFSTSFLISAQESPSKKYTPDWESLDQHQMPSWYDDSKIGLSMHWGFYAVPAWAPRKDGISYAAWYGQRMLEADNPTMKYHQENYGDGFDYDDFIPSWKAEQYDPEEWARFAKKMGAKYMFITSKHHDGFCLWDTRYTDRNSMKMGPRKDLGGYNFL